MTTEHVDSLLPEIETTEEPKLPDVEVTTDPPADKEPQARAEDGKFKGKEPESKEPAKEPAKAEPKAAEPKERNVPLAAHLEERRAWQAEKKALEERLAKLENPPKAPAPEPDYVADPKGYVDHKTQAALKALEDMKGATTKEVEEAKQTAQQAQAAAVRQQFQSHLGQMESVFIQTQPDYYDALRHLRTVMRHQITMANPNHGLTDQQLANVVEEQILGQAYNIARSGQDPVRLAYEYAKVYGYQPKQAVPKETLELPKVPGGPKQLPPDQTLGSGAGGGGEDNEAEPADQFEAAFNEMFKARKTA